MISIFTTMRDNESDEALYLIDDRPGEGEKN